MASSEGNSQRTVRVDCHLHTVHSGDSSITLEELAEGAARLGLDVVFVTDHHTIEGARLAAARDLGLRVMIGEEVRTPSGDLIGLFLTARVPYVLPVEEAGARVRAQGGLVYAPHPFDRLRSGLGEDGLERLRARGLLDIVEVFNAKVRHPEDNRRAAAAAERYGLPGGAGSDAHDPEGLGAAYLEMPDFDGPRDFLTKLPRARVFGTFREHAPRYLRRPR